MPNEIAFPFAVDRTGGIAFAASEVDVARQHIVSAVGTQPGERVMRPQYGCDTMSHLFDPNDAVTGGLLEAEIRQAVGELVPEVTLTEVAIGGDVGSGTVTITTAFVLNRTGEAAEAVTTIHTAVRVDGVVYEEN